MQKERREGEMQGGREQEKKEERKKGGIRYLDRIWGKYLNRSLFEKEKQILF